MESKAGQMIDESKDTHMLGVSPTGKSGGTYTEQHLCALVCFSFVGLQINPLQVL